MAILDFSWSRHKLQVQSLFGVVQIFNAVWRQSSMALTITNYERISTDLLNMTVNIIEVH